MKALREAAVRPCRCVLAAAGVKLAAASSTSAGPRSADKKEREARGWRSAPPARVVDMRPRALLGDGLCHHAEGLA